MLFHHEGTHPVLYPFIELLEISPIPSWIFCNHSLWEWPRSENLIKTILQDFVHRGGSMFLTRFWYGIAFVDVSSNHECIRRASLTEVSFLFFFILTSTSDALPSEFIAFVNSVMILPLIVLSSLFIESFLCWSFTKIFENEEKERQLLLNWRFPAST